MIMPDQATPIGKAEPLANTDIQILSVIMEFYSSH